MEGLECCDSNTHTHIHTEAGVDAAVFFFFLMFFFIWLHQVLVSVPGLFVVVMCLSLVVAWTPECPGLVAPQHVGS